MVEAVDRARKGEILGTLCIACAEKLVEEGFKFCAVDTTSRGTQTEIWEVVTKEPFEDVVVTQEPKTEITQSTEIDQAMDTQEPLAGTAISSETTVEEEINQEEEEKDNIHEPMVNTTVTEEPPVGTEASLGENDEQKPVDITVATQEPVVKMEVD